MEELYFTIAGCSHYFGSDFMEKGMKVKLEKEPDNEYDKEAIQVKIKGLGKIGYVANSPFTVKGESMSAGRLYDKIGDKAKGKVVFVVDGGVDIKEVNLGSLAHSTGKVVVTKAVAMGKEDVETFEKLIDKGVTFNVRKVPSDSPENMDEMLNKAKAELK